MKEERKQCREFSGALAATARHGDVPYLQWNGTEFKPKTPSKQPTVQVEVTVMHESHRIFGKRWKGSRKGIHNPTEISTVADTGCQTCTAGPELLKEIKCPTKYLIPTRHRILGITDTSLGIMGAALLKIQVNGETTRQMVFISNNITGIYLSNTALKELKLIDDDFPKISSVTASNSIATEKTKTRSKQCSCPIRAMPPSHPDKIPFEPTAENLPKLKNWLIEAFEASGFNTCTHQPLQAMTGAPVNIKFKDGITPKAVHTPITVPLYWQSKVKADLDRDVRLGIIEKVPQGVPTTWCSRMVTQAKQNGEPRRTVDLQQLNDATLRETHHTPPRLSLVSTIPANTCKTVTDA